MKKFIKYLLFVVLISAIGTAVQSCNKGDIDDLKERVDQVEKKVSDLESLAKSLDASIKAGKLITSVTEVSGGFEIKFSDDSKITMKHGNAGNDGKTPYVTIEGGNWVVYPEGQGTSTKTTLGTSKGDKGDKGDTGSAGATGPAGPAGPAGTNGTSVTVSETDTQIIITSFDSAGTKTGEYKIDKPSAQSGSIVVVETDYWVQFNVTSGSVTTGYRIGKSVVIPTSIKIMNPIIAGPVLEGQTNSLNISVSPSNALVDTDLIFFDYIGEGIVTRAEAPEFEDNGYFEIKSVKDGAKAGEYTIEFAFTEDAENYGGATLQTEYIAIGEKFDVCIAFVENPASISSIVVDGTESNEFEISYGYSRSVNSFTFADEFVNYATGDAAFSPATETGTSADTDEVATAILWKEGLTYDSNFIVLDLENAAITMEAFENDGTSIGTPTGDIEDYATITNVTDGLDAAKRELTKFTLQVADDGEAFETYAETTPTFIPGSYIRFTISVDAASSYGDPMVSATETLTYTYDVYYIKTRADLTVNSTQWLPNSSVGNNLGTFDALDVVVSELGFPVTADDLSMTEYEVTVWNEEDATWVDSDNAYFSATLDTAGEIAVTLTQGVEPGIYAVVYKVVVDGKNTFLTQRVNVVIPDYTIDLVAGVTDGYDGTAEEPFLNFYADDAAYKVAIEDIVSAATLARAKPDAVTTSDGENFPQVADDIPIYMFASAGHKVGENAYGLVSAPAELAGTGKWGDVQQFTLSVDLASGQKLPVKIVSGGTVYFENTILMVINENAVVEDSIEFDTAEVTAGVFNAEVDYVTAQTTAVDLTAIFGDVTFTNELANKFAVTSVEETITGYYNLVGKAEVPAPDPADPPVSPEIPADPRVASVTFEVGDFESVNPGGQLPPAEAKPLVEIVDGQLKTISRSITSADPIYQIVNVKVTDAWGNTAEAELKVKINFN